MAAYSLLPLQFLLLSTFLTSLVSLVPTTSLKYTRKPKQTQLFNEQPTLKKGPADNNIFSRFVAQFLPTPEDIGLSRFNRDSRPENYPCTKTDWATLIPADESLALKDKGDILLIRQVLAKTNLETRALQCVYDANKDGWKAAIFHDKVDKKGPAVVFARSVTGGVFGGYNPTGWVNYGEYRGSIAAFLFQFNSADLTLRPIKLAKISGAGLAQVDDGTGPRFGAEGLTIPLLSPNNKLVRSKLGLYYERLPDGGNSLLTRNAKEDLLVDLKVYTGVYAADEKIPYNDALPFSLN